LSSINSFSSFGFSSSTFSGSFISSCFCSSIKPLATFLTKLSYAFLSFFGFVSSFFSSAGLDVSSIGFSSLVIFS